MRDILDSLLVYVKIFEGFRKIQSHPPMITNEFTTRLGVSSIQGDLCVKYL